MRKEIITVLLATIALLSMSPSAMSGERYYRQELTPEEAYVIGKSIEAFGEILGAIARSPRRNRDIFIYEVPAPRSHRPSGWTGRRLSGHGEVIRSGDYCPYNQYHDEDIGRKRCFQ